jgi:hypothetical protein
VHDQPSGGNYAGQVRPDPRIRGSATRTTTRGEGEPVTPFSLFQIRLT